MKHRFRTRCLALLFAVAGYGLLSCNVHSAEAEVGATLGFGRILHDEQVEQVIALENPFDRPVTISSIQLTPPLQAQNIHTTAMPGESFRFELVIGEDRKFGDYEGWIKINFDDEELDPIVVAVRGYIVPPIELKPRPAFYVVTQRGKDQESSIEIINHREKPLFLTRATSDSERFSTKLDVVVPGKHYVLTLRLNGNAEAGSKTERILLETGAKTGRSMTIMANTIIRERVYTFPDSVDMGALPIELAADEANVKGLAQTLMVYRPQTSDFEVTATTNLAFLEIHTEGGPKGDRYQLTLTLIPEKVVPGQIEGIVRILTNDEQFGLLEVPVKGHIFE